MRGAWCLALATTHALKPALDRRAVLGAYASLASLPANAAALRQAELETIQLFEKATKSVVFIDTFAEQREAVSMNMDVPQGTGSGFVWDDRGHIVTNYHVIRNAAAADVTLLVDGGTKLSRKAQLRGVDPDKDIAVLTVDDIPKEKLRKIAVGSRRPVVESHAINLCPSHFHESGFFFEFEAVRTAMLRAGRDVVESKSGGVGVRRGQSFWIGPHAHPGRDQWLGAGSEKPYRKANYERDSDGRRDQPRELGRAAPGFPGKIDRHEHGHLFAFRGVLGRRFCHTGGYLIYGRQSFS